MRIESQFVNLTCVLVQSDELHAGTIQVIQDDFAVCDSSCNMRAELAMRPLHVLDAQTLALSCMRISIVEHSSSQVSLVNNLGAIDTYGLEYFFASKHGMCPLTIDVECSDV